MDAIQVDEIREIRERITRSVVSQERVAQAAGYHPTALSRILRDLRPVPADFKQRIESALDALETAEVAAEEERRRVLHRAGIAS